MAQQPRTKNENLSPRVISSDGFKGRDPLEQWREEIMLRYSRSDIDVADKSRFRAQTVSLALPKLGLVNVDFRGAACGVWRTTDLVRDGDDSFVFTLCLGGEMTASYGDNQRRIAPGGAMLTSKAMVGGYVTPGDATYVAACFSREEARGFAPLADSLSYHSAEAIGPELRILRAYLMSLLAGGQVLPSATAGLAARQVQELLAHILHPASDLARAEPYGGIKAARLQAIRNEIEARLADPCTNAEMVGRKLGLSGRYVQQLMEGTGLSFSDYVREMRLRNAFEMLRNPRLRHLRIIEISQMAGFHDLSPFNRAFRARFGRTPRDVRAER